MSADEGLQCGRGIDDVRINLIRVKDFIVVHVVVFVSIDSGILFRLDDIVGIKIFLILVIEKLSNDCFTQILHTIIIETPAHRGMVSVPTYSLMRTQAHGQVNRDIRWCTSHICVYLPLLPQHTLIPHRHQHPCRLRPPRKTPP